MVKKVVYKTNPLMYCTQESKVTEDGQRMMDDGQQHTLNLSCYLIDNEIPVSFLVSSVC